MSGFTTTEHMGLHLLTVVACAVDNENITVSQLNSANLLLGDAKNILVAAGEWDEDVKKRIEEVRDRIFSIVDGRRERKDATVSSMKQMEDVEASVKAAGKALAQAEKMERPLMYVRDLAPGMRAAIDACEAARDEAKDAGEYDYAEAFNANLKMLRVAWMELKEIALAELEGVVA